MVSGPSVPALAAVSGTLCLRITVAGVHKMQVASVQASLHQSAMAVGLHKVVSCDSHFVLRLLVVFLKNRVDKMYRSILERHKNSFLGGWPKLFCAFHD